MIIENTFIPLLVYPLNLKKDVKITFLFRSKYIVFFIRQ